MTVKSSRLDGGQSSCTRPVALMLLVRQNCWENQPGSLSFFLRENVPNPLSPAVPGLSSGSLHLDRCPPRWPRVCPPGLCLLAAVCSWYRGPGNCPCTEWTRLPSAGLRVSDTLPPGSPSTPWYTVRHKDLVSLFRGGTLSPGHRLCLCQSPQTLAPWPPHPAGLCQGKARQLSYVEKHQLVTVLLCHVPGFKGHAWGRLTVGASGWWRAPFISYW